MTAAINARWGSPLPISNPGVSETTVALTQNNAYAAGVFTVDCDAATVVISHVGIRITTVTGTPGADYVVSLQSLDTSGNPSGTILGGGSPASATITPSTTGWLWFALSNSYTATRGDQLAVVCSHNKLDNTNNITLTYRGSFPQVANAGVPYGVTFDGTTTTRSPRAPVFGWKNSDASIVGGYPSANTNTTQACGSTTEAAMLFNVPTNFCSTFTVKGARWYGRTPTTSTTNNYQLSLYSLSGGAIGGTTTNLQSTASLLNSLSGASASAGSQFEIYFPTGTLSTLTAGQWYAIGVSTTTGSDMNLGLLQAAAAADFNAWPYTQQTSLGTRTITYANPVATTTAFTNTATSRVMLELILADLTAPSGSAGMLYIPDLAGT